ncbi:MAG: DUF2232 domain-containing protein [Thermoflavifilum sp.]|nr:DUF2232 domain-containing protein [Thermoflavifilum sp.]MCL6513110.1 YybS family protein [Alicyclobacillus sp.]
MKEAPHTPRPPIRLWLAVLILCVASLDPRTAAVAVWLLPAPILVWVLNSQPALALLSATLFGCAMWVGHLGWLAWFLALGALAAGWVMAEAWREARLPYPALVAGSLMFVMMHLTLLAYLRWMGVDILQVFGHALSAVADDYLSGMAMDASAGESSGDVASALQTAGVDWFRSTLPGWVAVLSIAAAMSCLSLARWLHPGVVPAPRWLDTWRLPPDVVPIYVIALVATVLGWGRAWMPAWQMLNSMVLIAEGLLWMHGLGALWRFLEDRPHRRSIWWAAAGLVTIMPPLSTLCVLYGMIDCIRGIRAGS